MTPTPGRQLLYCLSSSDVPQMNWKPEGAGAGAVRPATVIRVVGQNAVNLSVVLDGTNDRPDAQVPCLPMWKTSIDIIEAPPMDVLGPALEGKGVLPTQYYGKAFWPPRVG